MVTSGHVTKESPKFAKEGEIEVNVSFVVTDAVASNPAGHRAGFHNGSEQRNRRGATNG